MRHPFIAAVLVCAPLTAFGQNISDTQQVGENNLQTTVQSGRNTALTQQYGSNNIASIAQSGKYNLATISQIGDDHEKSIVQTGNYDGFGSVQINKKTFVGSFSGTGGNAITSTTLEFEATQ
ncbi:MAG: hypothetical protein ACJAR9_000675 [Celeribacter sp.]|jgi:hypothetical protein